MGSRTFGYTGGWQTFVVPSRVTVLSIDCKGAGSSGHVGGRVTGSMGVSPGQVLYIAIGGAGRAPVGAAGGGGGWAGGGAGGTGHAAAGGYGGGGGSWIRLGSPTGSIRCAAGGAGGNSGDGGAGGDGGADIGESGGRGNAGSGSTTAATGGGSGPGSGATSSSGGEFAGGNGGGILGTGGHGGSTGGYNGPGGGGGGGGYYPGGGGCGGSAGYSPGSGGGGGRNAHGALQGGVNTRGGGGSGHGAIGISWTDPPPLNQPPYAPTNVRPVVHANTRAMTTVPVSATLTDPNGGIVRLLVRWSLASPLNWTDSYSGFVPNGGYATVNIPVVPNQYYVARLYTGDPKNLYSPYFQTDFNTNRNPLTPTLTAPAMDAQLNPGIINTFTWTFADPDPGDTQSLAVFEYRPSGATAFTAINLAQDTQSFAAPASTFAVGQAYEWRITVQDAGGLPSPPSAIRRFFTLGTTQPPVVLTPTNDAGLVVSDDNTFAWRFRDPDPNDHQTGADFRYRVVGTPDWIVIPGVATLAQTWLAPADTFIAGYNYEWEILTRDATPLASDWSLPGTFYSVDTIGGLVDPEVPVVTQEMGPLGCGTHRVFIYAKGGQQRIGEILPMTQVQWGRKRDDISNAIIITNGFGADCCQLLASLRTMYHELVIFRDGVRVWEGPITRISYMKDSVEIEARDVMQYVYRRILKQSYNDAYPNVRSVVWRSKKIIIDALARDDPNVLAFLTTIEFPDDATQSRARDAYGSTAWEEVDSMAKIAGLDYTVVGRRILLWDTHRPVGRLPAVSDGDFTDSPVITEYGMNLSTLSAVTDNQGSYGQFGIGKDPYYGWVETLASSFSETAATSTGETATASAVAALKDALTSQAKRNYAGNYPSPVVVRIPDNSALSPNVNIEINQLVPGVWIPLRSDTTCRTITQIQKLDSIQVVETATGEQVTVVMSPAPGAGQDPDQVIV